MTVSTVDIPDAFLIDTTKGGEAISYALQIAKDYDFGLGFRFGYTFTDAEDLTEYTSSRAVSRSRLQARTRSGPGHTASPWSRSPIPWPPPRQGCSASSPT